MHFEKWENNIKDSLNNITSYFYIFNKFSSDEIIVIKRYIFLNYFFMTIFRIWTH